MDVSRCNRKAIVKGSGRYHEIRWNVEILRNREQQERFLEQSQGQRGMSPEHIRAFVHYFYEAPWAPGITSPIPQPKDITFLGTLYPNRRIRMITRGSRPMGAASLSPRVAVA